MTASIVDTNVLIVANGDADHASEVCVMASLQALRNVRDGGCVVIDENYEILREYQNKVSPSGQPGPGDAFLKWVLQNQAKPEHCERVSITPHDERGYEEFPADPALATFDPSDRKFVAAALASRRDPTVLVALDRDWWDHHQALTRNGLRIEFLCEEIKAARSKRF